jgi:hypothetical protein
MLATLAVQGTMKRRPGDGGSDYWERHLGVERGLYSFLGLPFSFALRRCGRMIAG